MAKELEIHFWYEVKKLMLIDVRGMFDRVRFERKKV